jgi:DNA ligase-1
MMNAYDVMRLLDQVAATKSRTEKEALLSTGKDDPLLREVFKRTYDPFITYGMTPLKVEGMVGGKSIHGADHHAFFVLDALAQRKLTGNAAKEQVKELLLALDPDSATLLSRIIGKDLRAGFTANTINKVIPDFIEIFEVMLAHKFEEKRITQWPVAVEPKLDGTRVAAITEKGVTAVLSRNGKEFPGMAHLSGPFTEVIHAAHARAKREGKDALVKYLGGEKPAVMLDGEAISGNFNDTVGSVRRKAEGDAILHVFDIVPLSAFRSMDVIKLPYKARRHIVQYVVESAPEGAPIRLGQRYLANSLEEIYALYQKVRETTTNGKPGEGLIVKPLDGFYEKKRSYSWLKMKAEETIDLTITGAFEGKGKYEGMLGGVIVDHKGVQVRVSGFSDEQRKELWASCSDPRDDNYPIGRMIEVEYHEETPDGSLRHPRFVRFRPDKEPALDAAAE